MKRQAGFTLVEISIVMVIIGLLFVAILMVFNTVDKRAARNTTIQRVETIMDALSAFAARNYRIPCPADPSRPTGGGEPFGSEGGSIDGTQIGNCTAAGRADGIVPYAILQLGEEDVRDGWGNYITYKVNPDFTADPQDTNTDVHALCRTSEWIEGPRNKAPEKARFCCTGETLATEIVVCQNPVANNIAACNTLLTGRIWAVSRDPAAGGWYDNDVNALEDPNDAGDALAFGAANPYYQPQIYTRNIETIAYALISHGENEDGAFLNTGGRIGDTNGDTIPDSGGTHEILNANNTQTGVWSLPRNTINNASYFDDIIRFSTQSMILARLRKDSCAVP